MKKTDLYSLFILMTGMVFLVGGISYALLSYTSLGNKENIITTNGITLRYTEGSRKITLGDAMPMTDSEGKSQNNYFEFDLTGYTDQDYEIPYDITVRKSKDSADIDNAIKLYLTSVDKTGKEEEVILTSYENIDQYINDTIDLSKHSEKLLHSSKFASATSFSQKYRLRVWVSYDADFTNEKYSGVKFDLTVNIYGKGKIKESNNLYNLREKLLLDNSETSNIIIPDNLINKTGQADNELYQNGLYKAIDVNGGDTYYFRGKDVSNTLKIGDDLWKIIRINEDGTIRIIRLSKIEYDNYSGFMFNSNLNSRPLYTDGTNLEKHEVYAVNNWWYENNIKNNSDYKNIVTEATYCQKDIPDEIEDSEFIPTFSCGDNEKSKITLNVGLITLDELIFAGASTNYADEKEYYLEFDSSWTMTSKNYIHNSNQYAGAWDYSDVVIENADATIFESIHPVINLKADTMVKIDKDNGYYVVEK